MSIDRATRYVNWIDRRALIIIGTTLLAVAASLYLVIFHLPLKSDFSNLLPESADSVRDLRKLEARTKVRDTTIVIVVAESPEARLAAVAEMTAGLRKLPPTLVEEVHDDDAQMRSFYRDHKFLMVPLADLERGRDALASRIAEEKAKANPLIIDFDDEDDEDDAKTKQDQADLDALRARRDEAEARLSTSGHVSADGKMQRIMVRTAFDKTQAGLGKKLLEEIGVIGNTVSAAHPGVTVGVAGGIAVAVAEHDALIQGMVLSALITALLVGLVLVLYLRSLRLLTMVAATLMFATTISFGVAALTVGHLNAATAFLGAIIAGNGVNYGILVVARYQEERRKHESREALAIALDGTIKPTMVASLAAAIAYGSLAGTSFRGFADFAIIGAVGMVVCWVLSFLLLPALIVRFGLRTRVYRGDVFLGNLLVRLFGFRKPLAVMVVAAAMTIGASVVVYRYVSGDPFEYDMKELRSQGPAAVSAQGWMDRSDAAFGRGLAGKTYIAADRAEQVPQIVAALRKLDAGVADEHKTIGRIESIMDAVPPDQAQRLVVLGELRTMLDDPLLEQLDEKTYAEIRSLRPPDDLSLIDPQSLPSELADQLTEQDGSVGKLIAIRPALTLNEWNGHDLIRFSNAVRRLRLADGEVVTTSGSSIIFADILNIIRRDGPVVTSIAMIGLLVMVLLVVGRNRRAVAVLLATTCGTLAMVAVCALIGLRVNFLDFVALPITLGLGVDYAINLAHRQHVDGGDPQAPLRTSGAAVFMCSLTTIIGYGSLLVSQNLAIRGFGLASLIGEITCLFTALMLVPAIVSYRAKRA